METEQSQPNSQQQQASSASAPSLEGVESNLPVWNCKSLAPDGMTVGTIVQADCVTSAPLDRNFLSSKKVLILPKGQEHSLKILKYDPVGEKQIKLSWTSYQSGQHVFTNGVVLKVDDLPIVIKGLSVRVESVLKPSPDGQMPKPYGPFGPFVMSLPVVFWAIFAVTVLAGLVFAVLKLRRIWQRRKLVASLEQYDKAEAPSTEFYQQIRKLHKHNAVFNSSSPTEVDFHEALKALGDAYATYVTRKLQVPVNQWSSHVIEQEVQRYFSEWARRDQGRLKRNLDSVRKLASETRLDHRDIQALLKVLSQWVDEADDFFGKDMKQ